MTPHSALAQASSRKGTIAFVALEIYPTTAGGVGILLHHTIGFLLSEGYEVVLLLDIPPHEFERFVMQDQMAYENGGNLHAYQLSELCDELGLGQIFAPHPEIARSARIAVALEEICRRHDVDLVEFYDYCGPAYCFLGNDLPKAPTVAIRLHNTIELIARKIRSRFSPERVVQFAAERAALGGADLILTPGQHFQDEEIAPLYPEIRPERVQVSPPMHAPIGSIEYSSLANDVAFYGRLSTFKGLDIFLKGAVKALQDSDFSNWLGKFVVMGPEETVASAYSLEDMRGFIPPELQGRFVFTGRVDHATLMERLGNVAFACFANRMESFCYAAHELHTAGVPLILSDTPAFRDHFEEGPQARFFDRTATGLAEAMVHLAFDRDARVALSEAGRNRAGSYFVDHYAQHLAAPRVNVDNETRAIGVGVAILAGDNQTAVQRSIAKLRAMRGLVSEIFVLTLDGNGPFRFAGQRWRVETADGASVDGAMHPAPETLLFLRAGDLLQPDWLERATRLMARREDVGAVGGMTRQRSRITLPDTMLLPENVTFREPGLRALIRLNPREALQDALMSRPGDSESSMLLAWRAKGKLLITLPVVSCDTEGAMDLPTPSALMALDHDFDRYSRDYMALLIHRGGISADLDESETHSLLTQSRREPGFFCVRVLPRSDTGETAEVLLLRLFLRPGGQPTSWSAVQMDGDWLLRHDSNGPVQGALRGEKGRISGFVETGAALDVLMSPWSGTIEVVHGGRHRTYDLRQDTVEALRISFTEEGIFSATVTGQARGGRGDRTAARHLPTRFRAEGRCETLVLGATSEDFREWPLYGEILERMVPADPALFERAEAGQDAPLARLMQRIGARKLLLSSRIAESRRLMPALADLPESVEIGLALCGAPVADEHGPTPMAHMAGWYPHAARFADRLVCLGGPAGLRSVFASAGAREIPLVPLLPVVDAIPGAKPDSDAPISVALLPADLQPRNIMHMFNACIMASDAGLPIARLYVPREFDGHMYVLDELNLDIEIEIFDEVANLAFLGEGTRRVAMACYPQEALPSALVEAAALGWLPFAGATTDLDGSPDGLARILTETYWENSAILAEKLIAACADHDALLSAYSRFAADCHADSRSRLADYLGLAGKDLAEPAHAAAEESTP